MPLVCCQRTRFCAIPTGVQPSCRRSYPPGGGTSSRRGSTAGVPGEPHDGVVELGGLLLLHGLCDAEGSRHPRCPAAAVPRREAQVVRDQGAHGPVVVARSSAACSRGRLSLPCCRSRSAASACDTEAGPSREWPELTPLPASSLRSCHDLVLTNLATSMWSSPRRPSPDTGLRTTERADTGAGRHRSGPECHDDVVTKRM